MKFLLAGFIMVLKISLSSEGLAYKTGRFATKIADAASGFASSCRNFDKKRLDVGGSISRGKPLEALRRARDEYREGRHEEAPRRSGGLADGPPTNQGSLALNFGKFVKGVKGNGARSMDANEGGISFSIKDMQFGKKLDRLHAAYKSGFHSTDLINGRPRAKASSLDREPIKPLAHSLKRTLRTHEGPGSAFARGTLRSPPRGAADRSANDESSRGARSVCSSVSSQGSAASDRAKAAFPTALPQEREKLKPLRPPFEGTRPSESSSSSLPSEQLFIFDHDGVDQEDDARSISSLDSQFKEDFATSNKNRGFKTLANDKPKYPLFPIASNYHPPTVEDDHYED